MKIFIGADHRGYETKKQLKPWLEKQGYAVVDCGNTEYDKEDDFPDFSFAVADQVAGAASSTPGVEARGIVICGSGGGVTIAANKVAGIRCVLGMDVADVVHNRDHNDANMLTLAADHMELSKMKTMIKTFLDTPFSGEKKCMRRIAKIAAREETCCGDCGA